MELTRLEAHVRSLSDPRRRCSVLFLASRSSVAPGLPLGLYMVALDAQLDAQPAHLLLLALHPLPLDALLASASAAGRPSQSVEPQQRTPPAAVTAAQRIEFDSRVESFLLQLASELHASQLWTQLRAATPK